MPKVLFKQSGHSISCEPGDYLLDLCETQDGGVKFSCRAGACGACVIDVSTTPNGLNPMSARERRTLEGVGGRGSNYIHRLEPGDSVRFDGPYGDFVLRQSSVRDILLIANGTGVAPMMAILRHLVDARSTRNVRLYFGLRHVHDIFYREELDQFAQRLPNFRYRYCLSQPFPARWDGFVGRVTDLLRQELTPDVAARSEAYLCGGHGLVEDAKSILLAGGMSADAIYHEQFY